MRNFASRLAKHGCPTIYRCLALTQLLCSWWHQYGKFWIQPRMSELLYSDATVLAVICSVIRLCAVFVNLTIQYIRRSGNITRYFRYSSFLHAYCRRRCGIRLLILCVLLTVIVQKVIFIYALKSNKYQA